MCLLNAAKRKVPGGWEAYHCWCTKRLPDAFYGLSRLFARAWPHPCAGRPARTPDFLSGSSAKFRSCSSVPSDCSHSATCQPAASKRGGALSGTRLQTEHSRCPLKGDPLGAWDALQTEGGLQHTETSQTGSRRPLSKCCQLQLAARVAQGQTRPCRLSGHSSSSTTDPTGAYGCQLCRAGLHL